MPEPLESDRLWLAEDGKGARFQSGAGRSGLGVLYTRAVRRAFLVIVLGILAMDATGLSALVSPEACTTVQDSQPDGTCPALCVRCACCAQPIVPGIAASEVAMSSPQPVVDIYSHNIARSVPSKIFHVPKFVSSTI